MKPLVIPTFIMFLFFMITGCFRQESLSPEEILSNEQLRKEIMAIINNNSEMTIEMTELISKNKFAIHLLENDNRMIRNMLENNQEVAKGTMQHLIDIMRKDSVFCENMSFMMMNDEHMRTVICNMCDCSTDSDEDHKNTH
ncbi:hypothetical protein [Sinomicrobium sp. M5D2P17]